MSAKKLIILLLVLSAYYSLCAIPLSFAQDDNNDSNSGNSNNDVSSVDTSNDDSGGNGGSVDSAPTDQSVDSSSDGGSSSMSEQSRDSWASDPNFNDPSIGDLNGTNETNESEGEPTGTLDTTESGNTVDQAVSEAQQNESQAYQDLYSYEEQHGMDGSAEHQALQQAAAESSAITQIAQGAFDASNTSDVHETTAIAAASNQLGESFSGLTGLDSEEAQQGIEQALSSIPGNFNSGERAAAIGGSGLDPKTAGEIAQADAIDRGEGVGTQMGAYQIAYSTAAGTNTTGDQVTKDAINAVAPSVDKSDPNQSLSFAEAAFATGNSHGANLADVAQQLRDLGITENTIEAAAENKGAGDKIGSLFASNPADAQIGPSNAQAAPLETPAGPPPAPISAPQPAPAPAAEPVAPAPIAPTAEQPAANANSNVVGGLDYGKFDPQTTGGTTDIKAEAHTVTDNRSISVSISGGETRVSYIDNPTGQGATPYNPPPVNAVPSEQQMQSWSGMSDFFSSHNVDLPGFTK